MVGGGPLNESQARCHARRSFADEYRATGDGPLGLGEFRQIDGMDLQSKSAQGICHVTMGRIQDDRLADS